MTVLGLIARTGWGVRTCMNSSVSDYCWGNTTLQTNLALGGDKSGVAGEQEFNLESKREVVTVAGQDKRQPGRLAEPEHVLVGEGEQGDVAHLGELGGCLVQGQRRGGSRRQDLGRGGGEAGLEGGGGAHLQDQRGQLEGRGRDRQAGGHGRPSHRRQTRLKD